MPPLASANAWAVLDAETGALLDVRNELVSALPGSTVKPFLNASGVFPCRGALRIGGHRLDCTHPRTAAPLTGDEALVLSCNHYFAALALRTQPRDQQRALVAFNATLAATDEQRQLQALGHWGVAATPLAMARAYRELLRGERWKLLDGGKTGTTAQAAWFAGWAPRERPRFVAAVMTGGRGSVDARPFAEALLSRWAR